MGGDEDMAYFLQRLLGYGITGEVREEIFPVWTGSGRNGKGLLTQALQQLLGEYYKEMNCAVISDSRVCSNIDSERAKLIGARIAVFNELKPGEKLKTNEVQLLTGGDGFPVKAIYKNPVTVMPKHLAILVTNHMPEMSEVIVALVERILAIPFTVTFRDLIPGESETATLRQCDQTMKEKLKSPEGQSALFAWLVEGAVAWYGGTESLKAMAPTKVSEFTRKYLAEQDTVQAFLTDNCELGKTFRESSVALFEMYCEHNAVKCAVDDARYRVRETTSMLLLVLKPEFARHCTHHSGIMEDAAHHVVNRSLIRVTVDGYNMDPKVEQIEHPDPLVELIESVGPWLKETFPYWDMPDFTPKVNGEAIANRPTCPLQLAEMAEVGDHIAVKAKSGYWHHGIFVGRVEKGPYMVIDVYGDDKALSTICNRTLTAFTNGGTDYAIIPYDETISKEHSALIALHLQQTAEKQRWHYNAISNNCEHFATLCRCGRCAFP
eukprot:gene19071-biopygen27938